MRAVSIKLTSLLQRCKGSMSLTSGSHRQRIRDDLSQVRGLLPLLMKHRNGQKWSDEERITLLRDLRALSNLSPYLIPLILPGGILMLPLVACWVDRRSREREDAEKRESV